MIRLKDLLKEDDIVKNKKTGNVYVVKNFDPSKHDKPTPAEINKAKAVNGGELPKEKSAKPAPKVGVQKTAPKATITTTYSIRINHNQKSRHNQS